jgi:uncharacterized protein (TIGR02266 family)
MDFDTILFIVVAIIIGGAIVYYVVSLSKSGDQPSFDFHPSTKSSQRSGAERRQHPRIDINWPASIETSEGTINAEIKNISLGGAFIGCKKPFPIGQVFSLTMTAPNNEPVKASAEVVWSNANVPEDKVVNRGMGVRFIKMSERHLQIVRQLFPKIDSLTI